MTAYDVLTPKWKRTLVVAGSGALCCLVIATWTAPFSSSCAGAECRPGDATAGAPRVETVQEKIARLNAMLDCIECKEPTK